MTANDRIGGTRNRRRDFPIALASVCGVSAMVAAGLGVLMTNPERWVTSNPISGGVGATQVILADVSARKVPDGFDTRHLRLSSQRADLDARPDLKVGDRITFGGREGLIQVLEILAIDRLSVDLGEGDARARSSEVTDLVAITARDVEAPDAKPLRLFLHRDGGLPVADATLPRPTL